MTIFGEKECVTIPVISDSIGETASELMAASVAQHPTVDLTLVRRIFTKDEDKLVQTSEGAGKAEAMVLHAITNDHLAAVTSQFLNKHQLFRFGIPTPPIAGIGRLTGVAPMRGPGTLHHLNENCLKRIGTMEFAAKYDGGRDPRGFLEADVLPLGVSRTPRTSLNPFLAGKDLKAINLPLIPETHLPKQLSETDLKKVVGLANDPDVLNGIRRERMYAYGLPENTSYSDIEEIRRRLAFANGLYQKLGCIITDVASLSIKEAASMILGALSLEDHNYYPTEASEG